MQFKIRAINSDDMIVELLLEATDEADARLQIKKRDWHIVSMSSQESLFSAKLTPSFLKKTTFSLLLFSQELLALLNAGLTIVESLEALAEKESHVEVRTILVHLLNGLKEGKKFSTVLLDQPNTFPPLYVGIIQASERTSSLPQSLQRFIDYQHRVDLVRNKVVSAMIYPLILLFVGSLVSFFLIAYVVPRFAEVYKGTGRTLPWMSQMLLNWGSFAAHNGTWLMLAFVVLIVGLVALLNQLWKQGSIMQMLSKLPSIGEYLRVYHLSRIYLTLGMLLEGGIPIVQALHTASETVTHQLKKSLLEAQAVVQSGGVFSDAFEQFQLTTPISYRMLRVGEKTGELGNMLNQSAQFYEGEINRGIDRFMRGFEPILMAVIGVVVGTIVVLLYMPIFDLADNLS